MRHGWSDEDFVQAYLAWVEENPNERVSRLVDEIHKSSLDTSPAYASVTPYDALVFDVWRRLHELEPPAKDWYRSLVKALGFSWEKEIRVPHDSGFKTKLIAVLSLLEGIGLGDQTLTATYRAWVRSPEKRFRLPKARFTNTLGWTTDQIQARLDEVLNEIEVSKLSDAAGKWWNGWNQNGVTDLTLILRRAEEIALRGATIEHAHRCYVGDGGQDWRRTLLALDAAREDAEWARRMEYEPNLQGAEWDSLLSLPLKDDQLDFETMPHDKIQSHYESLIPLIGWPTNEEDALPAFQSPGEQPSISEQEKTGATASWNALHDRAGRDAEGKQRMVRLAECLEFHSIRWDTFVRSSSNGSDTSVLGSVYRASLYSQRRIQLDLRYGSDEIGDYADVVVVPRNGDDEVVQRMRWIAPGEFMMGSPEGEAGHFRNETLHPVTIPEGFWMADTPCTQEFWQATLGNNPSKHIEGKCPVERVSWEDLQTFVWQLNQQLSPQSASQLRLPTEAEWEFACRAGSTKAYCFVDNPEELSKYAWFGQNSSSTQPVKQLQPNGWGLYDMHGNVREWCWDWLGNYELTEQVAPVGPARGSFRVIRGGGWDSPAGHVRAACRSAGRPGNRNDNLGFRILSSAFQPGRDR